MTIAVNMPGAGASSDAHPGCARLTWSSEQYGAAHKHMLEVSRFWLGVGNTPRECRLPTLSPEGVFQLLKDGHICLWEEWTIRTTPARRVTGPDGCERMESALWVSSIHGFTTFSPANEDTVASACEFITKREARVALQLETEEVGY